MILHIGATEMHFNTKDITGKVFGSLTVTRMLDERQGNNILWECICNCGNYGCPKIIKVRSNHLNEHGTKSCRNHSTIHPAIRSLFNNLVEGARQRNYVCTITLEDFCIIIKQPCYYCGDATDIKRYTDYIAGKKFAVRANGIDRFDNTCGYTIDNSVSCCKMCNLMKLTYTADQFIEHAKQIAKFNS